MPQKRGQQGDPLNTIRYHPALEDKNVASSTSNELDYAIVAPAQILQMDFDDAEIKALRKAVLVFFPYRNREKKFARFFHLTEISQ